MGSSGKNRKIFYWRVTGALLCVKNIKVPFGIGHPPPTHQTYSICVQEGSEVPNLQTELNYLDSFKSYCNSSDLGLCGPGGWGRWVGGVWVDQL